MFLLSLVLVLGVLAASEPHGQDGTGWAGKKHIVFVLTDDQDVTLDSMLAMPAVSALLANCQDCHNFTNAFVATPIWCVRCLCARFADFPPVLPWLLTSALPPLSTQLPVPRKLPLW